MSTFLNSIHLESLSVESIKVLVLIALIVMVGIGILVLLVKIIKGNKKSKFTEKYIDIFQALYKDNGDVRTTLETIHHELPDGSKEKEAVGDALSYLSNSLTKDYKTAFSMIEEVLDDDEVDKMHEECIRHVAQKRQYLVTVNNDQP